MGRLGLPLLVGVAPALRGVLVRPWRTNVWWSRCPRRSRVIWVGVVGTHWTSRTWSTWPRTDRTQRTLNLLLNELLGVVDLLRRAPDDEQLEVGVSVGGRLPRDFHKGPRLLVDGLDILSAPAYHEAAFVGRNGEGHFPSGGAPTALSPASAPVASRHAWRTRGSPLSLLPNADALQQVVDDLGGVLAAVRRTTDVGDLIWTGPVILLELYPNSSIILNFLDHLSVASDDDAD